jgi:hypothetical protein
VQEVVLESWICRDQKWGKRGWTISVLKATGKVLKRNEPVLLEDMASIEGKLSPHPEKIVISFHLLQCLWPHLNDHEKIGLYCRIASLNTEEGRALAKQYDMNYNAMLTSGRRAETMLWEGNYLGVAVKRLAGKDRFRCKDTRNERNRIRAWRASANSCLQCGKTFKKTRSFQKYCTRKCYQESCKVLPTKKKCVQCGTEFTGARSDRKYCSQKCNDKAKTIRRRKTKSKV